MSRLRLLLVPTLLGLVCGPALAQDDEPGADVVDFSDDFNNNAFDAWRLADDPLNTVSIAERNQRLEFTFAENASSSARAGLAGRLWWFDASEPFRCRVTGHLTPMFDGKGTVGFFVQFASSGSAEDGTIDDGVQFEYNVNEIGAYVAFRKYANGGIALQDTAQPAVTGEGTAYFEYDGAGTLCASLLGYGDQADSICVHGLFPAVTRGVFPVPARVLMVVGANSDPGTGAVDSMFAWMDDFVIDEGSVAFVDLADAGGGGVVLPDDTGETDANGDGRVDLEDLVVVLRSGGGGERLREILRQSGFDSADFTSQQWSKLMTGLYTHRIAPTLYPRPSKSEQSAAISTLTASYVGAVTGPVEPTLPDTGTPDANNDGFVNFADVARVLEANTADKARLNAIFAVIGLDPAEFLSKKSWKRAVGPIYESEITPEFSEARSKKDRKRDVKALFKAY